MNLNDDLELAGVNRGIWVVGHTQRLCCGEDQHSCAHGPTSGGTAGWGPRCLQKWLQLHCVEGSHHHSHFIEEKTKGVCTLGRVGGPANDSSQIQKLFV